MELLVVVAIIGTLVGLLLPAVEHNHRSVAKAQPDAVREATVRDSRNGVYQRLMSRNDPLQVTVP